MRKEQGLKTILAARNHQALRRRALKTSVILTRKPLRGLRNTSMIAVCDPKMASVHLGCSVLRQMEM